MVVDRLLVKPGIEKRLEASIETATKLAGGLVIIAVVNGEERLYSQKLACTECGASVPQLEPRSFSFNSPYGACETCAGLGNKWAFDPAKVIDDPSKPLFDGGLVPARGIELYGRHCCAKPSARSGINVSKPFNQLPKKTQQMLLNGGDTFPGIAQMLERVLEGASDAYREWLANYMSPAECPDCHGKRLRPSSLAVRVKSFSIAEFTAHGDFARADDGAQLGIRRARNADRRPRAGRNPPAAGVSLRGRAGLHQPGPLGRHALRRAKRSASAWPRRSARSCAACCMCWMSLPSGCIRATTSGCWKRWRTCATWATRCWWWSTMPRPSSAPIT